MKIKVLTIAMLAVIFFASAFISAAQTLQSNTPVKSLSSSVSPTQSQEGIFRFNQQFTSSTVDSLIDDLEEWSKDNPRQPIRIILNSPGGEVVAGFTLIDELTHLRNMGHKITFVVYGMAASTAGFVLQAADRRIIGANAMILIHQVSSGTSGKLASMKDSIAYSQKLQDQFIKVLVSRSRLTARLIHSRIDSGQDWWLDAQEALKLGLVDEIEKVPAPQP
jgi:ATP-dependent Clp protease, protease subunit